jgi:ABC-type transport system substrate-binding protein/DNA-binding SARP family transcriptional activator
MRFLVLGPLGVEVDGRKVTIGGGRERALLALLLVNAGEVVSRDRLIDELWGGNPPDRASHSLDAYLSRLRKAFREAGAPDALETRAPGYVLRVEDIDGRQFEALAAEGQRALAAGDAERAAGLLAEALALWRGGSYPEVADEPWAAAEIDRLEELRLQATEARVDAELALGRHAALVAELERLVRSHPYRERLVGQCMLALYRSGRQADALAAYREARRSLAEELGLEPSRELGRLESAILAHDPGLDLAEPDREPAVAAPVPQRQPRRRPTLALLGAGAVVAIAVALTLVVNGGGGSELAIGVDEAGAVDPGGRGVTASARVGSNPSGVATGNGRVWVTNAGDGTVTRIVPETGQVDQTVEVGSSPAAITSAADAIWVANALDGTVSRIEPGAGRVVQTIRVGGRPIDLASGDDAVWVADSDRDAVVELDNRSGVPRRRLPLAAAPAGVAVGFGSLWVTEPLAHRVLRIDPRTGRTEARVGAGSGAGPIAIGAGAVWIVNTLDGTLSRINPTRNAVSSTVPVGNAPRDVAAGAAAIWVADEGGGLVAVDPETGAVDGEYAMGAPPVGVTLAGETPWVIGGASAATEHRGGTLRVSYSKFEHLDPADPFAVHPAIWRATGDGLVAVASASGVPQVVPDLALTVPEPTDAGRTYSFQLRPGLRYSTGEPVRASDFRREFERLFALGSDAAGLYSALRGADACERQSRACDLSAGVVTDDRAGTVILHLARPDPALLFKLSLPSARPVPPGTPRSQIARDPVPSTGPYRAGEFVPGERLALVRNEAFEEWSRAAQPDGFPDLIEITMDDDPDLRARSVLQGDADLALEIVETTEANIARLTTQFPALLRRHAQPNTKFLHLNVRRPPFDDVAARRALNLAIDRAAAARRLGGLELSKPTCQVLPPSMPGYSPYCPWTRGRENGRWHAPDLARARAMVRASGTAGDLVEFVTTRSDSTGQAIARVVASTLRKLGYRSRIVMYASDERFGRGLTGGDWDIIPGDWIADYPSPSQFLEYFLACANYRPDDPAQSTNTGGFCNPTFDRLIAEAERRETTNSAEAQRIWAAADRLAVQQAAWVPLVNAASVELTSERTGHFTLDPNSLPAIDQLWVR